MTRLIDSIALAVSAALAVFGCGGSAEPNYCPNVPVTHNCLDDAAVVIDTPSGCTGDPECSGANPVCDLTARTCVQCEGSDDQACTGITPTCGSDEMCHACTAHTQCASDVCRPDGSCSDGTDVAYVDPAGTDNTTCSKAMPCTNAMTALATSRPFLKFTGTTSQQVTINNQNVTLLADPNAQLTYTSLGVILTVTGTSQVSIYDLGIANGNGSGGIGISMPPGNAAALMLDRVSLTNNVGGGISATGGSLTVLQSQIVGNTGGGISISGGTFDIVNNFIAGNGGPTASDVVGGINFGTITSGGNHLDFNTITSNAGAAGVNSGVNCGTVTVATTFSNNIIYGNTVSSGGKQIGGSAMCSTTYSDIGPDAASGSGNVNSDPLFNNVATGNYHITSGSPCKDTADPTATLAVDVDGDTRPQGPQRDIGADEFKP